MKNVVAVIFSVVSVVALIGLFVIFARMSETYALGKIDFMISNFGKEGKIKLLSEPYIEVQGFKKNGKFYTYDMYFEQDVKNEYDQEIQFVPLFIFMGSASVCKDYTSLNPYEESTIKCKFTLATEKPTIIICDNPHQGKFINEATYVVGNYTIRLVSDYKGFSIFNWKRHTWIFRVDVVGYDEQFSKTFTFQSRIFGSKTYNIHIPMENGIVDISIYEKRTLGIFGRKLEKIEIKTSGGLKDPKGPSIPVDIFYFESGCKFIDGLMGIKPKSEQVLNAFQMCSNYGLAYSKTRVPINKII